MFTQTEWLVSGTEGYCNYRIPALVVSTRGTVLAFCEGRKYDCHDAGQIDLLLRRSFDAGATWEDKRVVVTQPGMTCGNPCPVVDSSTGVIWLPFCKNTAQGGLGLVMQGKEHRTVWVTRSIDDGATWAEPLEITQHVKKPNWTWYATGPGHGIQLRSGRLLIPCDHAAAANYNPEDPTHSHVIYSDDHGATWQLGGEADAGTNESTAVETADGSVYLNCRNCNGGTSRGAAWSTDGGQTFSATEWLADLVDPLRGCEGSLVRLADERRHGRNLVLFSNPASTEREKMTVRVSGDECRTWSAGKLLYAGPASYSDLAVAPDGTILCLYERGRWQSHVCLALARFDLEWLTRGID